MKRHWTDTLRALHACPEAVAWARAYPTLEAAWAACDNPQWMLWYLGEVIRDDDETGKRILVHVACLAARRVLQHNNDPRVVRAIEMAEQVADGTLKGKAAWLNASEAGSAAWSAKANAGIAGENAAKSAARATWSAAACTALNAMTPAASTAWNAAQAVILAAACLTDRVWRVALDITYSSESAGRSAAQAKYEVESAACDDLRRCFPHPPPQKPS